MATRFLLLFAFYFGVSVTIWGQSTKWVPIGATWHHNDGEEHMYGFCLSQCTQDTLYNSQLCKQIIQQRFRIDSSVYAVQQLHTYLSNDTVYYYNEQKSRFLALYIFNVQAGDTLTFVAPDTFLPNTYQVVVDSVIPIVVQQDTLIHVYNHNISGNFHYGAYYAEKIGAAYGAILPVPLVTILAFDESIRCYEDSLVNIHFFNRACDYLFHSPGMGIGYTNSNAVIQFYPNPAQNSLTIELPYILNNSISIEIMNHLGQGIFHQTDIPSTPFYELDLSQWNNGTYICKLIHGQFVATNIFIISK